MGNTSEPVCEVPVDFNRVGMILLGGLNPVAAAEEAGIETDNHAMHTVMEYQDLIKFQNLITGQPGKATTNSKKGEPDNESATTKRK
jgi:hypothetical protein